MTEQKILKMNSYFEEKIALCARRNKELLAGERKDEADFEKIRANVYDIFRTVLSAAVKNGGGDADAVRIFFDRKIGQIPAGWAAAYSKAKEHDDAIQMCIEQIKLDTVDEIRQCFAKIWEGAE